jgi:hypothetical protein
MSDLKNSFLMLMLWKTSPWQGRWSAFGALGPGGPAPEPWPNPLSLSRPTFTRQSHDITALRLLSLMIPKSLWLWLSGGWALQGGHACGSASCHFSALSGAVLFVPFQFASRPWLYIFTGMVLGDRCLNEHARVRLTRRRKGNSTWRSYCGQ